LPREAGASDGRKALERLHGRGLRGEGVRIGHLDTGVDGRHRALEDAVGSYVEIGQNGVPHSCTVARDSGEHGTQDAGVMVARPTGSHPGGCAPGASLASAAVIEGRRSILRVLVGVDWLLDQQVRIVCLPFGTAEPTPILDGALEALERAGVLVVAAVGNRGSGTVASPADRDRVLAVGAVDAYGRVPRFSGGRSLGSGERTVPDLVAPGCDVITTANGGGYVGASGTSIATAWVAGVGALLLQAHPDSPPRRLATALRESARPIAGSAPHRAGGGIVDPEASLAWLDEPAAEPLGAPASTSRAKPTWCDPRLQVQLATADPGSLVEALVLGRDAGIADLAEELAIRHGASPAPAIELPRLRTLFLRTRPDVLRQLAATSRVEAVSAPDTFGDL